MLIVGIIDYVTGTELSISIFYVLPIALVTWQLNKGAGIIMSVSGVIIWHLVDFAAEHASAVAGSSFAILLLKQFAGKLLTVWHVNRDCIT